MKKLRNFEYAKIPKRIYYVWLGKNKLPDLVKKNLINWKEKNPEFKIIRIDESNFDITKYSFAKQAYDDKNWAFASDVVRLDTIYNNGGFYFDTDVTFVRAIPEEFLDYTSVWGMENSGIVNSGLVIGAHKRDKDLKNILSVYKNLNYDKRDLSNLATPAIISKYFIRKGLRIENKNQILNDGQIILATQYFAPYHWWGGGKVTNKTIAIQGYTDSWGVDTNVNLKFKIKYNLRLYMPFVYLKLRAVKRKIQQLWSKIF